FCGRRSDRIKGLVWEGDGFLLLYKKLARFLDDGEIPIDNNVAEQSIRSFCIGKKNWVMCDTINGAKSSAIIYSLVETAKANKLRLYEYFNYL
ncbi:IS66 family transposase, partial [Coprococcus sp. AF19-8AC]|uniref:IS66 family transposase n=1 Tax=Coprococcus sp. AF19-8AC TaxID=2293090 RepID=UPI001A9BBEE0